MYQNILTRGDSSGTITPRMLKIRLKRVGRKNDPSFRIVVTEAARGPKSNKAIDLVGFYNPKTKERTLDSEKISHWMASGAQVSGTVYNMLVDAGVVTGKKVNVLPRKSPIVKEETEISAVAEAPAEEKSVESPVEEAASVPESDTPAPEPVAPAEEVPTEESPAPATE